MDHAHTTHFAEYLTTHPFVHASPVTKVTHSLPVNLFQFELRNHPRIPAHLIHADHFQNVKQLTDTLLVLAFQIISVPHQTVDQSASSIQTVQQIKLVFKKDALILVPAPVDSMRNVVLFSTNHNVIVSLATLETHSRVVPLSHLSHLELRRNGILVTHHLVEQMLNVSRRMVQVLVYVCQNIMEIHTVAADLSVSQIQIAPQTRLACETSVQIHVRECVATMQTVEFTTMCPPALVTKVMKVIPSKDVNKDPKEYQHLSQSGIHAYPHHVDLTVNAAYKTDLLFAAVKKVILEAHQTAGQNVWLARNVHRIKHVYSKNVWIHVFKTGLVLQLLCAKLTITRQYALVHQIMKEILS